MRHGPKAWWRGLVRLLGVPAGRGRRPSLRPRVELLEDRTVPAYLTWDGGGDGSSWFDPLNWDTDSVPGAADDVYVGGSTGVVLTGNAAANSLLAMDPVAVTGSLSLASPWSIISGAFDLDGTLTLAANAALDLVGPGSVLDGQVLLGDGAELGIGAGVAALDGNSTTAPMQ